MAPSADSRVSDPIPRGQSQLLRTSAQRIHTCDSYLGFIFIHFICGCILGRSGRVHDCRAIESQKSALDLLVSVGQLI